MASISENNKRIAKNTMLLYVRMIFMMLISLYTSRVVLEKLGISDFGIYNVVGGVVVLFTFLNNAMTSSIQRFLNFELGKKNEKEAKRVFSMSLNCQLIIAVCILIFAETIGLWFVNNYLNIPRNRMVAAFWVYQFSILSTCVGVLYAPYNAAIIAFERMSVYAYVSIFEVVLKLAVVYCLFICNMDKLILYGLLLFVIYTIIAGIYIVYCLKKFDICHYQYLRDKPLFKRLMSFSGWSLLGSAANIATNQGVNIIQNIFFGVVVNAAMGVSHQVNGAIQGLVNNFSTAYRPQITKSYASGNMNYFMNLLFRMSKFTYFLMLVMALPIIICCADVLNIWLKDIPEYAVIFTQLTIVYALTEAISIPLWMAVQATGIIKRYQIEISLIKIASIPIIVLTLKLGAPTEYVLCILLINNILNHIYRLFYLRNNIQEFNVNSYIKAVMWPCTIVTLLAIPIPYLLHHYYHGYIWLLVKFIISILVTSIFTFYLGLNKVEQSKIKEIVLRKFPSK